MCIVYRKKSINQHEDDPTHDHKHTTHDPINVNQHEDDPTRFRIEILFSPGVTAPPSPVAGRSVAHPARQQSRNPSVQAGRQAGRQAGQLLTQPGSHAIRQSVSQSVCLSVCLPVCLSVSLSVCQSVQAGRQSLSSFLPSILPVYCLLTPPPSQHPPTHPKQPAWPSTCTRGTRSASAGTSCTPG